MFKDLLAEIKGSKYQITLKVLLSKFKENTEREFAPVYYNSATKTVIGFQGSLDKSFQEIFNSTDNWISEGLFGQLNQLMTITLIFLFTFHYQEVHILNFLIH